MFGIQAELVEGNKIWATTAVEVFRLTSVKSGAIFLIILSSLKIENKPLI